MQSQYAPVILFTYKRARLTKRVLESLAKNYLARETAVYVFANLNKDDKDCADVDETRTLLGEYADSFGMYNIVFRDRHLHVTENMTQGIREVFENYDRAIVLEDDIITATNFLSYMNQALHHYEQAEGVFSVCAYNCVQFDTDCHEDTYLHRVFRSWGYGLWRDKYAKVDLSNTFKYACALMPQSVYDIAPSLYPFHVMYLLSSYNGVYPYLDTHLMYHQLANGLMTVFPKMSYCNCIDDGSGLSNFKLGKKHEIINPIYIANNDKTDFLFGARLLENTVSTECFYKFITDSFEWQLIRAHIGSGRFQTYLLKALSWMCIGGIPVDYYFKKHNFKRIAVYACGANGKRFYNLIKHSDYVKVVYAIDKDESKTLEDVRMAHCILPDVPIDAVVVTYIPDYLEISLSLKCSQPVVDLLSVVIESVLDFNLPQKVRHFTSCTNGE